MLVEPDIGTARFVTPTNEHCSNGISQRLRARNTTTFLGLRFDLTQCNLPRGPRLATVTKTSRRPCLRPEIGFLSSGMMRECCLESIGASALVSGDTASHVDTASHYTIAATRLITFSPSQVPTAAV